MAGFMEWEPETGQGGKELCTKAACWAFSEPAVGAGAVSNKGLVLSGEGRFVAFQVMIMNGRHMQGERS